MDTLVGFSFLSAPVLAIGQALKHHASFPREATWCVKGGQG